jgi:8-oxo-dGTP diphosphatase
MDRQEYLKSLPRKNAGSSVLIFNSKNELLLVKPSYKEGWLLPGGAINEKESPTEACFREVYEELRLKLKDIKFISVDYIRYEDEEGFRFVFYAGVLSEEEILQIKLPETELTDFKFVRIEELHKYLNIKLKNRIPKSVEAVRKNISIYLENGEYV